MKPSIRSRHALSSVISSILLSATVLVVGGVVWSYANGASSVIASDYHSDSMELVYQLQERVMVEHVTNTPNNITVYLYNYGDVDITADIYANSASSDLENPLLVKSRTSGNVTISMSCTSGDIIGIKVHTRRQNSVYYTYIAK